jgi:hypothetical protein
MMRKDDEEGRRGRVKRKEEEEGRRGKEATEVG